MDKKEITEEKFMDILKNGHEWHSQKIKDELEKILALYVFEFSHKFYYDNLEKSNCIQDNACFLFVFDEKINIRNDRDNVSSSGKTITFQIKESNDILSAYKHFQALIMEDEQD